MRKPRQVKGIELQEAIDGSREKLGHMVKSDVYSGLWRTLTKHAQIAHEINDIHVVWLIFAAEPWDTAVKATNADLVHVVEGNVFANSTSLALEFDALNIFRLNQYSLLCGQANSRVTR